jgi:hypothetical protein
VAVYPTTPVPKIPYATSDAFLTITSGVFESGASSRRPARSYPLFSAKLQYEVALWPSFAGIYAFFVQQQGMYLPFTFKDFNGYDVGGIAWPALYAYTATATTSNQVFDVPMFASVAFTLYDNGAAVTQDLVNNPPTAGKFYFLSGTGTDGRDQVKMNVTPGHVYTWQATGLRAVNAIFDVDVMSYQSLMALLTSTGIGITEVR